MEQGRKRKRERERGRVGAKERQSMLQKCKCSMSVTLCQKKKMVICNFRCLLDIKGNRRCLLPLWILWEISFVLVRISRSLLDIKFFSLSVYCQSLVHHMSVHISVILCLLLLYKWLIVMCFMLKKMVKTLCAGCPWFDFVILFKRQFQLA